MFTKSQEKKHFIARLEGVQKAIWDGEFHKVKLGHILEGVRIQYDRMKEDKGQAEARLSLVNAELEKDSNNEQNKGVKESLEAALTQRATDIEYLEKQMSGLQSEMDDEANPKSVQATLTSLRSMKEMLEDYIIKL